MPVTLVTEPKIILVVLVVLVVHREQLFLIQTVICLSEETNPPEPVVTLDKVHLMEQTLVELVVQAQYFYMRTQEFNHGIFNF